MEQAVIQSAPGDLRPSAQASPLHLQVSGYVLHRSDADFVLHQQVRIEHAESSANMGHHCPYDSFKPKFFPDPANPSRRPPAMSPKIIKLIEDASSEKQVAEAWAMWLNPASKSAIGPCPGYRIGLSQDKSAHKAKKQGKLKIDGALYKQEDLPDDDRPHWETSRLLIEFKRGGGQNDPFDDEEGDGASNARTNVRGQIITYVANAFSYQHRVARFFFLVNGNRLRVTRWDRSGTVFTEAFKYTQERERLRNVLWSFSRLDDGQQGFDTTAILLRPDDADYKLMDELKTDKNGTDISEEEGTVVEKPQEHYTFRFVREAFAESIGEGIPRYCLTVPMEKEVRRFLVGKARFIAPGMTGRGTRGFVAWDVTRGRFAFLKDAWRPHYEKVSTEGEILRDLRKAGVDNIPTYVCDAELGDVTTTPLFAGSRHEQPGAQSGQSQASGSRAGSKRKKQPASSNTSASNRDGASRSRLSPDIHAPIPRQKPTPEEFKRQGGQNVSRYFRHYRVVVEEVCLPIERFKTGKQLVSIIRDCVKAHEAAVTEAKVMHRDISGGNILICPRVEAGQDSVLRVTWRGILADWELSKPISDNGTETARQVVRTGTWQFASAYILDNPEKPVRVADEIESFFHVTLYHALRYVRHDCKNLQVTMFDYFDWYSIDEHGVYHCGADKRHSMEHGALRKSGSGAYSFLGDDGLASSQPLNAIFSTMLEWFEARYKTLKPAVAQNPNVGLVRQRLEAALARRRAAEARGGNGREETRQEKQKQPERGTLEDQKPAASPLLIDSHYAFLELLDVALDMDWPEADMVGDQLKNKQSQEPITALNSRSDPQPGDSDLAADGTDTNTASSRDSDNDAIDGEDEDGEDEDGEDEDDPDPDEPTAKRRRSHPDMKAEQSSGDEAGARDRSQARRTRPPPFSDCIDVQS